MDNRDSQIRIWKYPLCTDLLELRLPADAEFLHLGMQFNEPFVWVKLDISKQLVSRHLRVYGTGWPVAEVPQKYIGTFMTLDGALVYHVFEEISVEPAQNPAIIQNYRQRLMDGRYTRCFHGERLDGPCIGCGRE
jgi:hypothetical protein